MAIRSQFTDHVADLLQPLGPVRARAMFGGFGLYLRGLIFAVVIDGKLYFKTDEHNRAAFEAHGARPFTYSRGRKKISMSYYEAPAGALDNSSELTRWAETAYQAAIRASARRKPVSPRGGTTH